MHFKPPPALTQEKQQQKANGVMKWMAYQGKEIHKKQNYCDVWF